MAITLEQTDRTPNSVTFSVSGITDNRSTLIWHVLNQEWITLTEAYDTLYIRNYSTSGGDNGTITVVFWDTRVGLNDYDNELYWYDSDYNLKCWDFAVVNVSGGVNTDVEYITTIVELFWDNTSTKLTDGDFDMTLADQIRFQWFACYMQAWIGLIDNVWSIYTDILYGEDMREAAQKIYDTAYGLSSTKLPNRSTVLSNMGDILDEAYKDTSVYSTHLNGIKNAINNFNLKQ
ncbi:MAG TPA: hypothetical protein VEF53_18930 [Patescibacteria group bacterium]|nr:hypothetical protein [Patescibacteria group bacterium]